MEEIPQSATEPELATDTPADSQPESSKGRWLRKALLVVGGIAILVGVPAAWCFVGYRMPTASMAPTLLGDHFLVACQGCSYSWAVGKRVTDLRPNAPDTIAIAPACPLCGRVDEVQVGRPDIVGGSRVKVNRLRYRIAEPQRFDIVAYTSPSDSRRTYLHRLVGLPGDTLRVRNGDLFLVEGEVAKPLRPSDRDQDRLWAPLHDAKHRGAATPWWEPEEADSGWVVDAERPTLECNPKGTEIAWLRYQGELDTRLGFNGGATAYARPSEPTADLRIRVRVAASEDAEVHLAVREDFVTEVRDSRTLSAKFVIESGLAEISLDGVQQAQATGAPLDPTRSHELVLALANGRARLLVNGVLLLAWEDPGAPGETLQATALLGVAKGKATLSETKIERDVLHYVRGHGFSKTDPATSDVTLGENEFFLLGDNSVNALDSRSFGFVSREALIGPVESVDR